MTKLVHAAEYARLRGVSRMAVSKAIASGRIVTINRDGKRLIDVDAANVAWAANTDPTQQERGAPGQFAKTEKLARASASRTARAPSAKRPLRAGGARRAGSSRAAASSLVEEKTRSERLRIEKQELDLAERRGELLSRAGVRQALAAKLIAARETFEAIPDRLAARIAAENDAHKVHQLLRDEITKAMLVLSAVSLLPTPQH